MPSNAVAPTFPSGLRLLISGATGFIGTTLVRAALADGCELCVITRSPAKAQRQLGKNIRAIKSADALDANDQFDAIIHLAGANVFALPWIAARKRVLMRSRLDTADALIRFCERANRRPSSWIQASAVGFYPTRSHHALDETAPPGTGFAAELCQAIEQKVTAVERLGLRGVRLRLGLVLGRSGGVFPTLRQATRWVGGVTLGNGEQRVAWVHVDDVIGVMGAALEHNSKLCGAINVVAPEAPSYRAYIGAIAAAVHSASFIRVPEIVVRLSLGERAPLLLEGAEIVPKCLLDNAYPFRFATLERALTELCNSK